MNFSKMWKVCAMALAVASVAGLCACEWGAGDDADSWSDSFNWVNFSGTYRLSGTSSTSSSGAELKNAEIVNQIIDGQLVTYTNYTSGQPATTTYNSSSSSAFTGQPFTVIHQGQNLTITDGKTGAILTGKFKSMRSASGYENSQAIASGAQDGVSSAATANSPHALPKGGDTIIGSFEVKGDVGRMVGTFQGTVYDTNTDGAGDVFGNRTLTATFVGGNRTTQLEAFCTANEGITTFIVTTNGTSVVGQ